jgi:galactose mutarotase-like enzyme
LRRPPEPAAVTGQVQLRSVVSLFPVFLHRRRNVVGENTGCDDGFALSSEQATFSIEGNGYSIAVEFKNGFDFAQIFAPKDKEFIAIEPMTAETNALCSGKGPRVIALGEQFIASFRVAVSQHA